MSGFEPPAGRRSFIDQGFVPPNRQQQIPRPPIKHFSSGNSQEGVTPNALPQPQSSSGGFFSSFRKRSIPPPSATATAESSPTSFTSGHNSNQGTNNQPSVQPAHPRRLSSRELVPVGNSGMSSAHTSSSHEVMLVDPYSMPREPDNKPPTTPTAAPPSPANQRPTHVPSPSTSSVATNATASTARPRPLHPELRSLMALNAARK